MKSFLLLTFLATAFAGFCQQTGLVTKVIDGDTYKVFMNGSLQTVRLLNADAPELGQFFGRAASDSVAALIQGRVVQLDLHQSDLYGRRLVNIYVNRMSLDSLMIAKGWAFFYYKYSRQKELAVYEAAAKIGHRGIWQCLNNVPPWIWRKLNKRNKRIYEVCRPLPSGIMGGK